MRLEHRSRRRQDAQTESQSPLFGTR